VCKQKERKKKEEKKGKKEREKERERERGWGGGRGGVGWRVRHRIIDMYRDRYSKGGSENKDRDQVSINPSIYAMVDLLRGSTCYTAMDGAPVCVNSPTAAGCTRVILSNTQLHLTCVHEQQAYKWLGMWGGGRADIHVFGRGGRRRADIQVVGTGRGHWSSCETSSSNNDVSSLYQR